MEKYYRFAGLELAAALPDSVDYVDDGILTPFRAQTVTDPHRFSFEVVEELTAPTGTPLAVLPEYVVYGTTRDQVRYLKTSGGDWQTSPMRVTHRRKEHHVQLCSSAYKKGLTPKTLLNACATEHLVAQIGGFVFHTAYISWEGGAILFTAPSGTGKSTQAELWRSLRCAEVINGDRAVVRVAGDQVLAEGIPFSGSSQICKNRSLPIKAIVYLAQAPVTSISRLTGARAFARIWEGISVNVWDSEDMELVSATVQQVIQSVPVYYLPCTPDESAVAALEQQLRKQECVW